MSTIPITDKRELAQFFANAARPRTEWRIACAHEKFAYRLSDLKPVGYGEPKGLREWLTGMEGFGWMPIGGKDGLAVTGLLRGQEMIGLGDGGQIRFSGAPAETLHEVSAAIDQHLTEAYEIGEALGIGFLGMGFHPTARREGTSPDALQRCCGAAVSLNYENESDMARKFRVALSLQPVVATIFASSPFVEGKPNGWRSNRARVVNETNPADADMLAFVFENSFGFERYAEYAVKTLPFFLDINLTGMIDITADAGSAEMLLALPSFWTGVLYDSAACDEAWQLVKGWSAENRRKLHADAPRLGFAAEIGGQKLLDIARTVVAIAQQGLRRRAHRLYGGADETRALAALTEIVESEQSRADFLLMQCEHFADFSMASVFETGRLRPPPEREKDEEL